MNERHYQLVDKAVEYLKARRFSVHTEKKVGKFRVDVLGELDTLKVVIECGNAPEDRLLSLYKDHSIKEFYWWRYNKLKPFIIRLCTGCCSCHPPFNFLDNRYPLCCNLKDKKYSLGEFYEKPSGSCWSENFTKECILNVVSDSIKKGLCNKRVYPFNLVH